MGRPVSPLTDRLVQTGTVTDEYAPSEDTRVGVVPMGYVDGVPRATSAVGPVRVGDRAYTVAGRVCTGQFELDPGTASLACAGDEVDLFGDPATGVPSAQDWAEATGTISYEIITWMSTRLPRVFRGEGEA